VRPAPQRDETVRTKSRQPFPAKKSNFVKILGKESQNKASAKGGTAKAKREKKNSKKRPSTGAKTQDKKKIDLTDLGGGCHGLIDGPSWIKGNQLKKNKVGENQVRG